MDRTLESGLYMNLSPKEALKELLLLVKQVKKVNGIFSLLWHNTFLFSDKYNEWHNCFIEFISTFFDFEFCIAVANW